MASSAWPRISSLIVSALGLPVSRDSTSTMSWARSSIARANWCSIFERSYGVVSRQVSNAVDAAPNARSTSSAPDSGAEAYT